MSLSQLPQRAFTLIELLITIVLSGMICSGLFFVYAATKHGVNTEKDLILIQENVRLISNIFQQNISAAGFSGCRKINEVNLINHTNFTFAFASSVLGYTSQNLPSFLEGQVIADTDVIVVQKCASDLTRVITKVMADTASVKVVQNPAHQDNLFLLLADCVNAELFTANNYIGNTIVANSKFIYSYDVGVSEVARCEEIAYFIGDSGRFDAKGRAVYSLYEVVNRGNKQELVSDIKSMKISYGVNTHGGKVVEKYCQTSEMQSKGFFAQALSVIIDVTSVTESLGDKNYRIYIKLRERNL